MSIAVVHSRALAGIKSPQVTVEVHISRGLPGLAIVGLPELAVRESKDRVRSAILINHLEYPLGKIIVNLAPADLPKEGGQYDLAIALGIITANKQLPAEMLGQYEFSAELSLTGDLRPVRGILPIANACKEAGRKLIVALGNANEACLVKGLEVLPARNLMEVYAHLSGASTLGLHCYVPDGDPVHTQTLDMADIRAQYRAKRALDEEAREQEAPRGHDEDKPDPPSAGKEQPLPMAKVKTQREKNTGKVPVADKAQRNFTDPDSRIMPYQKSFVQGYNAQVAMDSEHQIIVATDVTNNTADVNASPNRPSARSSMCKASGSSVFEGIPRSEPSGSW